jgi:predicted secreted protein
MRTPATVVLLLATASTSLLLAGCGGKQPKTIEGNEPILPQRRMICRIREAVTGDGTEDVKLEKNTALACKVGHHIRLELEAASGTGFEWKLTGWREGANSSTTAGAKPTFVTADFDWSTGAGKVEPVKPGTPGGPAHWIFEITGKQPGAITLDFALARSWEKGQAPADQRSVTIVVE